MGLKGAGSGGACVGLGSFLLHSLPLRVNRLLSRPVQNPREGTFCALCIEVENGTIAAEKTGKQKVIERRYESCQRKAHCNS